MMLRAELPVHRNSTLNVCATHSSHRTVPARGVSRRVSRVTRSIPRAFAPRSARFRRSAALRKLRAARAFQHAAAASLRHRRDRSSGSRPACGSPPTRCLADRSPNACRISHSSSSRSARPRDAGPRRSEMRADVGELGDGLGLQPEMIHSDTSAALRDREIDARILDHPLRVIVLAHGRIGAEQAGIETNALRRDSRRPTCT